MIRKITLVVFFSHWLVLSSVPLMWSAENCSQEKFMSPRLHPRPQIKAFLDRLQSLPLVMVGHTTDSHSLAPHAAPSMRLPKAPSPFPAGLYKASFEGSDDILALMVQTESRLSHYTTIIPGKTDVGGYVQLFNHPQEQVPEGQRLTMEELDYLIRLTYSRFCMKLSDDEYEKLNRFKDMLLAIMFSSKPGIEDYHKDMVKAVRN